MITNSISDGIVIASIEPWEVKIFMAIARDLTLNLSSMSETNFLEEMQSLAPEARSALPEISEFVIHVASHNGPKVAILDFPESTVGKVRSTPTQHLKPGELNLFEPDIYRGLIVGMANWYGYGYTTQQNAVIHNNVVQVKQLADVAGHSASAPNELGLHVEDASYNLGSGRDISPDFLTLHYFRNPHLVPTIVSIPEWNLLSASARDSLSEEWFFNQTNPAQGGEGNNPVRPVSVLYGNGDDPWIRLNTAKLDLTHYTLIQQSALREICTHLESRRFELGLKPGQVAIIDNRRVLHGRPAFRKEQQPRYDGSDRWQRRLAVSNDPSRIQQHEHSPRVVDPLRVLQARPN